MTRSDELGTLVEELQARRIDRRQFLHRSLALGLSLPAAGALLAACGGDDEEEEAGGGGATATGAEAEEGGGEAVATDILRVHLDEDIENLDPAINPGHTDTAVATSIFENLVGYRPDSFEVANELAETFEPSEDGLRYDFTLKQGIQFHGGYGEVTAEDVKYSYERIAGLTEPKLDSPYAGDWAALESVEVTDTYSGTIVLKEPFAPLMTTTLPVQAGQIVSKKAVEERGDDFGTQPIGTGPYEFVEWSPGSHVLLRKFADYGGATDAPDPPWQEIRFAVIPEDNATTIALETGELDFAVVPTTAVERFQAGDDFEVIEKTTLNYNWIGMNVQHENLQDKNVRLAVIHGIDVPSIIEAAFEGRWTRATAIIPPGMPVGYWADAPVYERDVDRAREFLAAAGAEGLRLEMAVSTGEEGATIVAEIVQANLNEVGFDVEVLAQEGAVFGVAEPEANAQKQLFYTGFTTNPDPSWSTIWFTCDQVGVWNWMSWCNEEYSQLDKDAAREVDADTRNEMYVRMQQIMDEDAVALWVAWPTEYLAVRKGITPAIQPDGGYHAWAFLPS